MERLSIQEILTATRGTLISSTDRIENLYIEAISTDSRKIEKNSLFVPLNGARVNSHEFILDAFQNGAIATLTSQDVYPQKNKIYIKVDDTLMALQDIAQYYRQKFTLPVIGITGSVGKTTTKEMISCVLESKHKVLKTQGNFNGQIGLPLTLFNLDNTHQVAVIEMGISEPNEMEKLSKIAAPNYAVVSNVGLTHIENFDSQYAILEEKMKIASTLSKGSTLFINGDNDLLSEFYKSDSCDFKVKRFGIKKSNDFFAENIMVENQSTTFDLVYNGKKEKITIPVIGNHNIYNVLSAIAVGLEFNLSMEDIKLALKNYRPLKMRQHIYETNIDGKIITIIDDTYNANPDSMKSSLEVLSVIGNNKRKIAILADMLELGGLADQLHFEVGLLAAEKNIDVLLTVGEKAKHIASGAESLKNSLNKNMCNLHFNSNEECCNYIDKILKNNDVVLAKGSRGMHLEEIINNLIKKD